jgi:hypothetical protein
LRSATRRDRASDGAAHRAALALLAVLPALATGAATYLQTAAKVREAELGKAAALDSYGSYVTDQLRRDEALLEYLRHCRERDAAATTWAEARGSKAKTPLSTHYLLVEDEQQADAALDEIARTQGWRPSK